MSVNTYLNNNLVNVAKATQVQLSPSDQVSFMPTASASNEGYIYQYIGTSTEDYINGYFYKCVSDGAATPAYSWQPISTQPTQAAAATPYTDTDGYLNADNVQDALHNLAALVKPGQWSPLEDGYTNMWIQLDDDELQQTIRFSSIDTGATISWGDGTGTESLIASSSLTSVTHTYNEPGEYVIKIKGTVTLGGTCIAAANGTRSSLTGVELSANTSLVSGDAYIFGQQTALKHVAFNGTETKIDGHYFTYTSITKVVLPSTVTSIGTGAFQYCRNLYSIDLGNVQTIGANAFSYGNKLISITIPDTVTSIGNNCFASCTYLANVYMMSSTPPTLGTSVFGDSVTIYVPAGSGETYKTASRWSSYANQIVEQSSS